MMSKASSTVVILGVISYNEVTQHQHRLAPATQLGDKMVKLQKMLSKPGDSKSLSLQNILSQDQQKDS